MSPAKSLLLRFGGWCTVRIPTDPDPTDEPRGASGYTFAFAGEADLDRIVRLQPDDEPSLLRSGAPWDWGVTVYDARTVGDDGRHRAISPLKGAKVRLLGAPRLENRNWLLTWPGWEPVVPFDLQICGQGVEIRRKAPLSDRAIPFWQEPEEVLLSQGAKGISLEPETVGTATGMWDAISLLRKRAKYLKRAIDDEKDAVIKSRLESRYFEVRYALENPTDRRVMAHYAVERFSFEMTGPNAIVPSSGELGTLDPVVPWSVAFWLGGWDADLFAAYFQGSLEVPFKHV